MTGGSIETIMTTMFHTRIHFGVSIHNTKGSKRIICILWFNEKCIDMDIHIDIVIDCVETNHGCYKETKNATNEAVLWMDPKRAVPHDFLSRV